VEAEKTVARKPALQAPCRIERSGRAPRTVEPQERCGDVSVSCGEASKGVLHTRAASESPAWFRAEQTVERVRNPEDGRCRRSCKSPGQTDARFRRALKGRQNPMRGAPAFARAGAVVAQSSFEETDNLQRGSHRGQIRWRDGSEKTRVAHAETRKVERGEPKARRGSIATVLKPLNRSRNLVEAKDRGPRTLDSSATAAHTSGGAPVTR